MTVCCKTDFMSGYGAAGSALDWGSRGRVFKSRHSDHWGQSKIADLCGFWLFFYGLFYAWEQRKGNVGSNHCYCIKFFTLFLQNERQASR